ncbi:MAG: hypothetical protein JW822_12230 [Spirochaetales bacterium]|nr:hypothetical protein [Spirochaetales bacterium]
MKKLIYLLTLVFVFSFLLACPAPGGGSGGGGTGGGEDDVLPDDPKQKWTVIIHFAIDNNIDYAFERDFGIVSNYLSMLESIEAADENDKIDIVMLMDSYNSDTQGQGWVSAFDDGYYHLSGGSFNQDIEVNITEVNSGSLSQTQDFLNWAVTNHPADGYIYSVFNHGSGFDDENAEGTYATLGIAFDDSHDDSLSHYELGQATAYLKSLIGQNVDMFYAYACLMGGVELAYELRNNCNYLLFSEELFPADYWSYEALATITHSVDGVSAFDIGKAFCDSAYAYFSAPSIDRSFTLSLIRLSLVDDLAASLESYADAAMADINSNSNQACYNEAAYESFSVYSGYTTEFYYVDLGDYLDNIQDFVGVNVNVKNAAAEAQERVSDCVAYMKNYNYESASGMTIFHNIWYSIVTYEVETYKSILTFGNNTWADFVTLMDSFTGPDSYEPDNDFATSNTISIDAEAQKHTFHETGDQDYIKLNLTAGINYSIETHYYITSTDTVLYLYNSAHDLVTSNDDGGVGLYSLINYNCSSSGEYYIRVFEYGNNNTGAYEIDVAESSLSADYTRDDIFKKEK